MSRTASPLAALPRVLLGLEPFVLADVAQMRGNRSHPHAASGDLDHHLRCPAHGRLDPSAEVGCASRCAEPRLGLNLDDPVARIEKPATPLDEDSVDAG